MRILIRDWLLHIPAALSFSFMLLGSVVLLVDFAVDSVTVTDAVDIGTDLEVGPVACIAVDVAVVVVVAVVVGAAVVAHSSHE